MKNLTGLFFGTVTVGILALATVAAEVSTSEVVVNTTTDGFYQEATIDQRFVTSPRARPTDVD